MVIMIYVYTAEGDIVKVWGNCILKTISVIMGLLQLYSQYHNTRRGILTHTTDSNRVVLVRDAGALH